jgi:formylmethanofuran dehydrogenase subunit E
MARKNEKTSKSKTPKTSIKKTRKDRKKPVEESIVIEPEITKNLFPKIEEKEESDDEVTIVEESDDEVTIVEESDDEVTIVEGPPKPDAIIYAECDSCGELQWQHSKAFDEGYYESQVSCVACFGSLRPASVQPRPSPSELGC